MTRPIGVFKLGIENVRLLVNHQGDGGSFNLHPDQDLGTITISLYDGKDWPHTIAVLLHEAMEYAMCRLRLRYTITPGMSRSHADYTFVMNHEQFAEMAEQVGHFMAACVPVLSDYYGKNFSPPEAV